MSYPTEAEAEKYTQLCSECKGTGETECCDGHMCPGTRTCFTCNGRKVVLKPKYKKLKRILVALEYYK